MAKITVDNYKEELKGVCVIEVSGESCANCLTLLPILNTLVGQRTDCRLVHIELDETTQAIAELFNIEQVPTILVTKDGEVKARCKGFQPEEILEIWLDAKLEEINK